MRILGPLDKNRMHITYPRGRCVRAILKRNSKVYRLMVRLIRCDFESVRLDLTNSASVSSASAAEWFSEAVRRSRCIFCIFLHSYKYAFVKHHHLAVMCLDHVDIQYLLTTRYTLERQSTSLIQTFFKGVNFINKHYKFFLHYQQHR